MHEMSLTEGVIRIIEEQAAAQGFVRVRRLWMEIGRLSTVDPEAMRFCFAAVRGNSAAAAEAELEIVTVPGQAWCMDCAQESEIEQRYDPCPRCGGYHLQVTGGEDMRITEMEVE